MRKRSIILSLLTAVALVWGAPLNASAQVAHRDSLSLGVDDTFRYLTVELSYQVGQRTDLSFLASRQQRQPREGGTEYKENQLIFQVQRRFGEGSGGGGSAQGVSTLGGR